jgi:hypothetical protein
MIVNMGMTLNNKVGCATYANGLIKSTPDSASSFGESQTEWSLQSILVLVVFPPVDVPCP